MAPETGVMAAWKDHTHVSPKASTASGASERAGLSSYDPGTAVQVINHEGDIQTSVLESFVKLGAVVDAGER